MNVPDRGETDLRRVIDCLGSLATGGTNAIGYVTVTLAEGQTETAMTDPYCAPDTLIMLCPTSAPAAAAQVYVKSVEAKRFVLGHLPAQAGATLRYERRKP
ncbi:hypothetical protein [uncultured Methylobacterium sp.]|jgi:hypothetical protein|uniref:hypothetical protein n=1 Tax=uncultured Methylobacterium sp. TaxID=157278 RepID=UPI00262B8596|nr:hypothetical protein [uncultured Methylobacterium sp.]